MKKTIITLSLALASSVSFANGFSPWEDREITASAADQTGYESSNANIGFAPWRDQETREAFAHETGIVMDIAEPNIFRPWS